MTPASPAPGSTGPIICASIPSRSPRSPRAEDARLLDLAVLDPVLDEADRLSWSPMAAAER